jgi:putative oxidoreductase
MFIKTIGKPDTGLLLLRLSVGVIFLVHGVLKLQDMAGTAGFFWAIGIPAPEVMSWVVALVESVGGALLILGLWTGLASILLSCVMIVAILKVKWAMGFVGGYEFDLALLAGNLSLLFSGAGKYSLDAKIKRG